MNRKFLSSLLATMARVLGRSIVDARTGEKVGSAFVIMWGGRIIFLGLRTKRPVFPEFRPQSELRYGRQVLQFRSHSPLGESDEE